ncbi:PAAR domain-containing protein [Trinickia acidisoli]|uniref:PAAR domain-containing protein n=1 Tax=Trinickia acidisoli TaxID=2767482 RepID=UPI001A8EBA1F|nr:PAAR domain-containing protein [Trinickia acidisoli]
MKQRIAKAGDGIGPVIDTHTVVNGATGETQQQPFPFDGVFYPSTLEANVRINGMAVATIESEVHNDPPHIPPPSYSFVEPPTNLGEIATCNIKVRVNGKKAARATDLCRTCTEIPQAPPPQVQVRQPVRVYVGTPSPGDA